MFIQYDFLFKKFNFVTKDGRIQLQIEKINPWCNSHNIGLCIIKLTTKLS